MSHTYHRYHAGDEPVAGYRLTDHLGAGGFGEVWKANAPGGTEVALKIIDLTGQQGVQEFTSLRVVKKVRHPNLISLQAFWMKDEEGKIVDEAGEPSQSNLAATSFVPDPKRQTQSTGIAMTAKFARPVELIIAMQLGSMSLHKRLEDCRALGMPGVPVAELLEYLEQAARGIDFLNKPIHDLGKGPVPIVHGDVKPHNILVVGDAAVVCDFGLARAVETLRKTSMAPVTVAYAAPESFKGKVTPTSDQYSLAITYAELRTGRLPFDETMTPYQVMEAHVTRSLDFSRLPEPERMVIDRATVTCPEDRWPSSRDMILALRHAVAKTGELPLRPGEAAYTGGPTPSHSLTARPHAPDTQFPTQHLVDPHKDTSHHGGRTPSQMFSLHTAPSPRGDQPVDALAETSMLGPGGVMPAPRKKSAAPLIGAIAAAAVVVLGIVFVPKLLNSDKNLQTAKGNSNGQARSTDTSTGGPTEDETDDTPTDPIEAYKKKVQGLINAAIGSGDFSKAIDQLDIPPSKLELNEKEALQKRLHDGYLSYLDTKIDNRSFNLALSQLDEAPSAIGLTPEDQKQTREKVRSAWLDQAREEFQNDQWRRAADAAQALLRKFDGDREAQFIIARCQWRQNDNPAALATLNKLGKTADQPAEFQPLHAGLLLLARRSGAPDVAKLLDEFLGYGALAKNASASGPLALSAWERSQLDALGNSLGASVPQLLRTLPADQVKTVWAKLEQFNSSPELRSAIANLLVDMAMKKRPSAATDPAAALVNPFVDPAAADNAFQLLELAQQLSAKIDKPQLKLSDELQRELAANFCLATAWKTKPNDEQARQLALQLTTPNDANLGANALPVWLVVFHSAKPQAADQAAVIKAAVRIAELFQKQYPVADEQAVTLYQEVLGPALKLADAQAAAKSPPADLDKLYASVAEFISHYQRATWPFADKHKEMEQLLTKAIKLNAKAPKYLTSRGAARISQNPPNVEGALADAAEASKLDANLPAAYALQGHARIYRSRQRPTRAERLEDLEQALEKCKLAVQKSKPDDAQHPMHLLYLSMALLERANIENDLKLKKELFAQAIVAAQAAVDLEKAYPDYAWVALGNALEDMAWLAGAEPEKNYRAAIDAFSQAIEQNPAAHDAWIGRARCFYKSMADSKLDPSFLGAGRTKADALQAAINDLEQAKQLKANLVEPNLWLGKANQQLDKIQEADAALETAVKLAEEQKLLEQAMYLIEWTRNAVPNPGPPLEWRNTKTVRQRADKLRQAPNLGGSSNVKQAALIIGDSLQKEKKLAEAIKEYDLVLTDYDKSDAAKAIDPGKADSADASLLLARAACRYSLPSDWNLSTAEAVIKDTGMVSQLKPGPSFEAYAAWYAANAKSKSLLSASPTFTEKKKEEYREGVVTDLRRAIELAPNDPGSWEWRNFGAVWLKARLSHVGAKPEAFKSLGPEARRWIDDAIAMAAKRPDLANQMTALQRNRQELDALLAKNGVPR